MEKTAEDNNLLQTSLYGCREKLKKSCEQKQQLENERSEIIKSWRVESDSQQRQIENLTEKLLEQLKNKGLWNKTINLFKRKIFIKK
jgi:hypothetical protein